MKQRHPSRISEEKCVEFSPKLLGLIVLVFISETSSNLEICRSLGRLVLSRQKSSLTCEWGCRHLAIEYAFPPFGVLNCLHAFARNEIPLAASLGSFIGESFFLSPLRWCFAYVHELIFFTYHVTAFRWNVKHKKSLFRDRGLSKHSVKRRQSSRFENLSRFR